MSTKRKISVRRIIQTFVTIIVVTGSVLAILSASGKQDKALLADIDIRIKNDKYKFVDKAEVRNLLLKNRNIDITTTSISKLDIRQMEQIISANPWIANAQLYIDNKQVLHVNITQRVPVARFFEKNGNSYYLDHTLRSMPLSDRYIHYTTVVTNVPELRDDSFSTAFKGEIVALVQHVEKDSFWNAQVSQIIVADDTTGFELVPILGEHHILFGDTSHMQEKFDHLFAFYTKVLNRIGWNKYQVLDLRFNGQLVASPALPWKKPKDNADNMNWVTSIIDAGTKAAESDTPRVPVQATVNAALAVVKEKTPPAKQEVVTAPRPAVKKTEPTPPAAVKAAPPVQEKAVKATLVQPAKQTNEKPVKPVAATKKTEQVKQEVKKELKKEERKEEPTPKYIYKGNENNNQ